MEELARARIAASGLTGGSNVYSFQFLRSTITGFHHTDWQKGDFDGLSQMIPRGLHARINHNRFAQSKFKIFMAAASSRVAASVRISAREGRNSQIART